MEICYLREFIRNLNYDIDKASKPYCSPKHKFISDWSISSRLGPKSDSKHLFRPSNSTRMSKSLNCPKIILDFIHVNELSKKYSPLIKFN
jgi:hypothetical protein